MYRTRTVLTLPLGTDNYLFSLFCMNNYFLWALPSSRFAVVDLKVPLMYRDMPDTILPDSGFNRIVILGYRIVARLKGI